LKLVIASKNKNKIRELKEILADLNWQIVGMEEIGITQEIEETADTFEGNALIKASKVMELCGEITIADDSGICVEALAGAPGVYSARYSGKDATDYKNNKKLLKEMEGIKNRKAKFVCAIAVARPCGKTKVLTGEFKGEVAHEVAGSGGFGYDVLFYLPEYKMTSAQIPAQLKNKISHRAKALKKLKNYLSRV